LGGRGKGDGVQQGKSGVFEDLREERGGMQAQTRLCFITFGGSAFEITEDTSVHKAERNMMIQIERQGRYRFLGQIIQR